jgi:hypothetical protein
MSFVVSSLTNYVNEQNTTLQALVQFKGETANFAELHPNIKSAEALQLLTVAPVRQAGGTCAYNASGTTTFTQRILTTGALKYEEDLCLATLQSKWTQLLLKAGQDYTEEAIPEKIIMEIMNKIQADLESTDWTGTVGSNFYDGLGTLINAASGVVTSSVEGTLALSETNIRTIVRAMAKAVPAALKGDSEFKLFMGYDAFDMYMNKISTDNLYNMFDLGTYGECRLENTPYKIKAVHGLDGLTAVSTTSMYMMKPSQNMHLGFDSVSDENNAQLWYSKDDRVNRYSVNMRRGWQIAFPTQIVKYTNLS